MRQFAYVKAYSLEKIRKLFLICHLLKFLPNMSVFMGDILFPPCLSVHVSNCYVLVFALILLNNLSKASHYFAGASNKHCLLTFNVFT